MKAKQQPKKPDSVMVAMRYPKPLLALVKAKMKSVKRDRTSVVLEAVAKGLGSVR